MVTKRVNLGDMEETLLLCGEHDSNLKAMEKRFGVQIFARSSTLAVRGTAAKVDQAIASIEEQRERIHQNQSQTLSGRAAEAGRSLARALQPSPAFSSPSASGDEPIFRSATGKPIYAITAQQKEYVQAMMESDLVLSEGPAGTGKTFLAVVCALRELHAGTVGRIVLTRPVVEAGERLGFLPGDFMDKVNPYLRPLYDAFYLLLGAERFRIYREDETVEIVPLAYMRGRTLENAFVILDEAQNTTPEQMKMFLTRMGTKSKMVVTGDVTQIDLDFKQKSGFVQALKILKGVPDIRFVHFSAVDIVRHELVRKVVQAYDAYEKRSEGESKA
jgi:phosphate starvation-inducible PhoH-like protein